MPKRTFDLVLSAIGLALLAPLLFLVAVLVKLDSPGPVFYRGVRTGRYGRPFRIFKFRSMVVGADRLGTAVTGTHDPRLTRAGRFLRRYKLDELPQLINVLAGDMSFVGPRPEMPQYTAQFSPEERLILTVRPGITDYSSIEFSDHQELVGDEAPTTLFETTILPRKNALRLRYVREQSFLNDLRILWRTVWLVVKKPFRGRRLDV